MLKKLGYSLVVVGALMFGVGVANTFAKNPNCPDDCKCPDNVECSKDCTKDKTDHCNCKH